MGYPEKQEGYLLDNKGYEFLQSLRTPRSLLEAEEGLHREYALYTKTVGHELSGIVKLNELGINTVRREKILRSPIRRFFYRLNCKLI